MEQFPDQQRTSGYFPSPDHRRRVPSMHTPPNTEIGYNYIFFQVKKKRKTRAIVAHICLICLSGIFFLPGCESGLHVGSESTTLTRWVIIRRLFLPMTISPYVEYFDRGPWVQIPVRIGGM
jgi:hypothetical protein